MVLFVSPSVIAIRTAESQSVSLLLLHDDTDERIIPVTDPMLESVLDQGDEEEFVPQPYRGKTASKSVSKKKKEEKKKEPEKKEPPKKAEADDGQISLGDLSSFGEAA